MKAPQIDKWAKGRGRGDGAAMRRACKREATRTMRRLSKRNPEDAPRTLREVINGYAS